MDFFTQFDLTQITILVIFGGVFAGIISEKLDKTIIVLIAACIILLGGFLGFEEAIHAIDFDTITLLMGMMLVVETLREVKLFDYLAIKLGIMTKGNPLFIFLFIGIATAVFSAFLDNVTTVLIIAPLMISLVKGIGLPPKIFVLSVIFLSNIGGAATLIGDPPNILIGSQVPSLTFASFLQYMSVPVIISCVALYFYYRIRKGDVIRSRNDNFTWLFTSNLMLQDLKRQQKALTIHPKIFFRSALVLFIILLGFFTHAITHIEPSVIALLGATLMLIAFHRHLDIHHLFARVEWPTLLFFACLFVVVGAMEHAGILEILSHELVSLTQNLWVLIMIILWASAILSAIVDNIPFVAVMIPVLKELMKSEVFAGDPKIHLLWWALALGACFGGNGSMIGASANVVTCAIAKSRGVNIGFKEFAIEAIPVTLISIIISSVYLSILYIW